MIQYPHSPSISRIIQRNIIRVAIFPMGLLKIGMNGQIEYE